MITCERFISKADVSLDVEKREGRTVMVYMFITRIAMAEGSNVKIGLHTSEVRENPKKWG